MATATPRIVGLAVVLIGLMVGQVISDLNQDKNECKDQLVAFSPCLSYASGESKAPTAACCVEMNKDFNTNKRCLCLLVKDRNEPNLGLTINATQALGLPYVCHVAGANISECPELLHLAPDSPDAKFFLQFDASARKSLNAAAGATPKGSSNAMTERWIGWKMVAGMVLIVFSVFITCV
ncbi:hypothetical protein NMG60_11003806 [Bertholletia excelsa]